MKERFAASLKELCMAHAVSGQEQQMVRLLKDRLSRHPGFHIDPMGNACLHVAGQGKAPSLMLVAHTDEVGGIVSGILPNGLLRFRTVGGIDRDTLPGSRVLVDGRKGVITCVAAHLRDAMGKQETYIDIGAESAQQVRAMGVEIGSAVTMDTEFVRLSENRICSRAVDDRVGCAVLLELIDALSSAPPGDVYFAFSVREETSMSGAHMLAQRYGPDCAVAVDTVPMNDIYQSSPAMTLGAGAVLQLMDGVSSAFKGNAVHPGLKKALLSAAGRASVPVQLCAEPGSWVTDADSIHIARWGIPTGYVSIPRRYAHSASELVDLRDALGAVELLKELIYSMESTELSFI